MDYIHLIAYLAEIIAIPISIWAIYTAKGTEKKQRELSAQQNKPDCRIKASSIENGSGIDIRLENVGTGVMIVDDMVCRCGEVFTSYDGWLTHAHSGGSEQHGGFTTDVRCDQVWVEGIPETAHYETVIVQPAYDQEIIVGTVCAACGAQG